METIYRCPVCDSNDLEQEYNAIGRREPVMIGGPVTNYEPILNGCSCNVCGTKFKFNKAGKCPSCKGTGIFETVTGSCGIVQYSSKGTCGTCDGEGVI